MLKRAVKGWCGDRPVRPAVKRGGGAGRSEGINQHFTRCLFCVNIRCGLELNIFCEDNYNKLHRN